MVTPAWLPTNIQAKCCRLQNRLKEPSSIMIVKGRIICFKSEENLFKGSNKVGKGRRRRYKRNRKSIRKKRKRREREIVIGKSQKNRVWGKTFWRGLTTENLHLPLKSLFQGREILRIKEFLRKRRRRLKRFWLLKVLTS